MAYDKIVDSAALDGALTDIADAIRGKTGGTEKLFLEGMAEAIAGIETGGGGSDGGFPNIEVVTIATSFTLANMALPIFSSMVEDGKQTYFLRKTKSVAQNTCIGAYFNVSGKSVENSYTRWKSGQGANSSNAWNASFDCVANAGDEYYKVVIL